MMKKLNILFLLFVMLPFNKAMAETGWNASQYSAAWGVPENFERCQPMGLSSEASIGMNSEVCKLGGPDDPNGYCEVGGNWYVRGSMMMVALELNEYGAYFCPTIVGGDRVGGAWGWAKRAQRFQYLTVYHQPSYMNLEDCFWVCKPGHHGDKCQDTEPTICNTNQIKRSNYNSFSVEQTAKNIESEVAMFVSADLHNCANDVSPSEHDIILGVSNWTESGRGVFVQPYVVGAFWGSWNGGPGYIRITPLKTSELLCRSGYEPNFNGTDCIAVDASLCEISAKLADGQTQTCDGHQIDHFDQTTMEWIYNEDCEGVSYRCKELGYGFDPQIGSNRKCIDCESDGVRKGITAKGMCVSCSLGQIFDALEGECVTATVLTQDDLRYGPNKSKDTPVINQCWTQFGTGEYYDCIWNSYM